MRRKGRKVIKPAGSELMDYPDAVHTEISVEYPLNCPEAYAATVMVSPTRDLGEDGYEDYDWSDLELSLSDIEALIGMAKS